MLRAAGIVALIVLTACGQSTPTTVASPSPVIAQGNWAQDLTFAGELTGHMTGIVADTGAQKNECSGVKARNGQVWSDTFYGTIDVAGNVWEVNFYIPTFRGPGTYTGTIDARVEVNSPDKSMVWQSRDTDKVMFTLDRTQQSGSVDAALTNATTGKPGGLQVTGSWNCRG
jgi:hypothetical protein